MRLHIFAFCTLKAPDRGGKKNQSLSTIVENRIQKFLNETPITNGPSRQNTNLSGRKGGKLKENMLQKLVCAKVEKGRIKDAVGLLVDNNEMASNNSDILALLQEKHPRRSDHELINMQTNEVINVNLEEVKCSLESFPRSSAGGIDGLTPQLLKDMIVNVDEGPEKTQRLQILTDFINLVIAGQVPICIRPIFFAARLIALKKKDNGVRPIAISNSLRRICSKIVAKISLKSLKKRFSGRQLGIGTRSGCEIAVHKTREFVNLNKNQTIVKIDFKNAFNTLNRSTFLKEVIKRIKIAAPFIDAAYSKCSFLFFNNEIILSDEGVQQGDPLGPLIFCLALQSVIDKLTCPLNLWYMDDGIIGGTSDAVLKDISTLEQEASKIGLALNRSKCEVFQPE